MRISAKFAPYIYGIIQAAITTGIATGIAAYKVMGTELQLLPFWFSAWSLAWVTMLPVVILIAPAIHRFVIAMTNADE